MSAFTRALIVETLGPQDHATLNDLEYLLEEEGYTDRGLANKDDAGIRITLEGIHAMHMLLVSEAC